MSTAAAALEPDLRARVRRRRFLVEAGSLVLGAAILIWSLVPVYNMFLVALDPGGHNEFSYEIWPSQPTLGVFADLWNADDEDVRDIWPAFGNSIYIGVMVMAFTVLIASLASFAVGRMRLAKDWSLSGVALLTYAIPASTLIIPFLRIMHIYGLTDNLWAVIAAEVTFATPYAILVLQHYAKLIPSELDDAARIDGASAMQVYLRIYMPLMAPALAAVGTYALLFAWNDYFYQYMLLLSEKHTTVAMALEQFFDDDDAPWNYMMAIAILYSLPPIAIFYGLRRFMASGLTLGGVRG
ncbi:MAG: carbohydrate ABC transporter permease [Xanthobacteraceae bacterium]|jgi:multiple sugar transport system permease protein